MRLLIYNIGQIVGIQPPDKKRLCGAEMGRMNAIENGWLLVENERIVTFGRMEDLAEDAVPRADKAIDAEGGVLMPSFCDSHTHIVYAGSREGEFLDKINGLTYEQIAARGGGILASADRLSITSEEELYHQANERLMEVAAMGTGAIEIKSGYGLSTESELKMLRVIKRLKESSRVHIKSTFLGAHAVARDYRGRQSDYVDLVCREMIPEVGREALADYVDVFCDDGFFTVAETERILDAAAKWGLRPKIHANELAISGGVQVGVKHNALSVDHLEAMGSEEIEALRGSATMPTVLPGVSLFLGINYAPARAMIDAGLGVALASDYNPGSSPSGNMRMVMSLASFRMKLSPTETLNAATLNGAYALGSEEDYGSITQGKIANFVITKPVPSFEFFTYAYQTPLIKRVFLRGEEL